MNRWLLLFLVGACGDDESDPANTLATDGCLSEPDPSREGLRFQCEGDVLLEIVVDGPFEESPATSLLPLAFGPSAPGDSYAEPKVMACCPRLDCEEHYERACMADLAEQGCKSIEPNLRDYADERFRKPSVEHAVARAAINKIADYVRDHQGDCREAFVVQTSIEETEPRCDTGGAGLEVEYDAMLASGRWAFDPPGAVDRVTTSVASASYAGVHPTTGMPQTCESADDNDGVVFFETEPKPGSKVLTLASGSATLHGPSDDVMGAATFESAVTGCAAERCSSIAVAIDRDAGTASLEDLQLRLAGTAAVGDPSATIPVDGFVVRLWDATPAAVDRAGVATILPGAAWFVVTATSGGSRATITATNETALVLREAPDGWTSSAFMLARRLPDGDRWSLVVQPARWQ